MVICGDVITMEFCVCSVFVDVSEREQNTGHSRRLIEKQRIDNDLGNYNDWLRKGGEGVVLN